jgi:hypothetical protein
MHGDQLMPRSEQEHDTAFDELQLKPLPQDGGGVRRPAHLCKWAGRLDG